jgi:hypothetical protein
MKELHDHDELVNWRRVALEGQLHLEEKFMPGDIVAAMQGKDADAVKQHSYRVQTDDRVGETMAQIAHDGHGA